MIPDPLPTNGAASHAPFTSKLSGARERFLASVVAHALTIGRRSATDFVRAFPPVQIMEALADQPRLRANLLVTTTGLHEKVALKKTPRSAGEDLAIAIEEGITNAAAVVALFDPDDRVRYLDHGRLWAFVAEGEFWRVTSEATTPVTARDHVAFILERARAESLLTDYELVDGIGIDVLVEALPKEDLVRLVERAVAEGRAGRAFKDDGVLQLVSCAQLVEHVSLAHVWQRIVAKKLAFPRPEEEDTEHRVSIELVVDEDEEEPPAAVAKPVSLSPPITTESAPSALAARRVAPRAAESASDRVTVVAEPPPDAAPTTRPTR
jgi:hypothetical protein